MSSVLSARGPASKEKYRVYDRVREWLGSDPSLNVIGVGSLLLLALSIYGAYASKGSWYYDDWSIYSLLRAQHGGYFAELKACASSIPGNRELACVYHAGEYSLFGAHRTDYQFAAIGFLVLNASLLFSIVRRCHMARGWAWLMGAALIIFPASDATRLWAVGAIAQYAIALVLCAILLALIALGRRGARAVVLHLASAVLIVVAMATYEIALPFVALGGSLYLVAYRNRAAVYRWGLDVGLLGMFLLYRVAVSPVAASTGLVVHRSIPATLSRVGTLLSAAWETWKYVYLPGRLGTAALVCLSVAVLLLLWLGASGTVKRLYPWFAALACGMALSAAGALVYMTANDLYVPEVSGLFNRLNMPGSFGYVAMAVALLGILYEICRLVKLPTALAVGLVCLVAAGSAEHQIGISVNHIQAWEASWTDQKEALAGYRVAVRRVPKDAVIIGLDTPIWERGFIPIFAASWDLRGAIEYETSLTPPIAYPLLPNLDCGSAGMIEGTAIVAPYDAPGEPMYFVSPVRETAVRIGSQRACESQVAQWGRPPFWGSTVTGVKFKA